MRYCFVFCHGFGFDKNFWNNLTPYFSEYSCLYLEDLEMHALEDDMLLIGIGHSLGLIKLLSINIPFQAVIGLQGFINFLGFNHDLHLRRQKDLAFLGSYFDKSSKYAIRYFHRLCGVPVQSDALEDLNIIKLKEDLEILSVGFMSIPSIPIFIIGSKDDKVVTPELIYDNFRSYNNVTIEIVNSSYHCLGYKNPELAYKKIMNFLVAKAIT